MCTIIIVNLLLTCCLAALHRHALLESTLKHKMCLFVLVKEERKKKKSNPQNETEFLISSLPSQGLFLSETFVPPNSKL